jgi:hypothetical protein
LEFVARSHLGVGGSGPGISERVGQPLALIHDLHDLISAQWAAVAAVMSWPRGLGDAGGVGSLRQDARVLNVAIRVRNLTHLVTPMA